MNKVLFFIISIILSLSLIASSKSVPESSRVTYIHVPYSFTSSRWNQWKNVEYQADHAKTQVVVLLWEGVGGRVDLGDSFISWLHHTNKYVIIRVVGGSYSMHAIVACQAQKLEFNSGFLMFHLRADYYGGHDVVDLSRDSLNENTGYMNVCLRKGVVNQNDINTVNSDKELWVYPGGYKQVRRDSRNGR